MLGTAGAGPHQLGRSDALSAVHGGGAEDCRLRLCGVHGLQNGHLLGDARTALGTARTGRH